jgi:hypothetical protein
MTDSGHPRTLDRTTDFGCGGVAQTGLKGWCDPPGQQNGRVAPDSEDLDPAWFRAAWDEATRTAEAAYREIRPVARKLRHAMQWEQFVQYDFIESQPAIAESQASYLVTRTIKAPDADYPNLKRWDVITPGYQWHLRRHLEDAESDELAMSVRISLTVDGVARPRSGDLLTPATAEAWSELTAGVLEPRAGRMKRLGQSPFRLVLRVLVELFPLLRLLLPAILLVVIGLLVLSRCG